MHQFNCFCGMFLHGDTGETIRCWSCGSEFKFGDRGVTIARSLEAEYASYVWDVLGVSPLELDAMGKERKLRLIESRAERVAAEIRKVNAMFDRLIELNIVSFLHPEIDKALVEWYRNDAFSHLLNHARWAERDAAKHKEPKALPEVIDEEWEEYNEWAAGKVNDV